MKQIPLTQGKVALVDDADYDWLNQWKWYALNKKGYFYAVRHSSRKNGNQYLIYMAREILGLERGNSTQADHQHHNTLDNRRDNLRICTNQQNQMNQKSRSNCSSQFKGVAWHKLLKKWRAQIQINKAVKHLGVFQGEKEAARAYNEAAKKHFGEFAYLNVIV